jgi:hypothetical protein
MGELSRGSLLHCFRAQTQVGVLLPVLTRQPAPPTVPVTSALAFVMMASRKLLEQQNYPSLLLAVPTRNLLSKTFSKTTKAQLMRAASSFRCLICASRSRTPSHHLLALALMRPSSLLSRDSQLFLILLLHY